MLRSLQLTAGVRLTNYACGLPASPPGRIRWLIGPECCVAGNKRALELDDKYADTRVLFAETYAVKAQQKELYTKLLTEVLAMPDDVIPELVPETKNAKRKAKKMMGDAEDLF